jgi:hypothetical protein
MSVTCPFSQVTYAPPADDNVKPRLVLRCNKLDRRTAPLIFLKLRN